MTTNNLLHLFRSVGTLPPEPQPDKKQIPKDDMPSVIKEFASKNGRFVVWLTVDSDGIYRGRCYTWLTHADDDVWSAFWTYHDSGIISDDYNVVLNEAERQICAYENEQHGA
jgi:hypothetical protein